MDQISPDTLISPADDLVASDIDGEVMLVSIDFGAYVGMNEIGSAIWRALSAPDASPIRMRDLVAAMQDRFDGDPAVIEDETRAFVTRLRDRKLVTTRDDVDQR